MKRILPVLLTALFLTGCAQLESIPYNPPQTPQTWLSIQPFVEFQVGSQSILVIQPTTSVIVYLLGIVTIGAGLYYLRIRKQHCSRFWWGTALLLWGGGAILAGTSYEAFSYQLKCSGRDICIWTSWLEILYLVLSVTSIDAMLIAEAYSCAVGKSRKVLVLLGIFNFVFYVAAVLIGLLLPVKFLISFEMLILVAAPCIVIFLFINGRRYFRHKQRMDLVLLGAWCWLIFTIGVYFIYSISGLTQSLWVQGIWFSENDVLHIGLILWMIYLAQVAAPWIQDKPAI